VLMIGTNDSVAGGSDSIADNIQRIVEEIRARCPGSKVLLLGILPRSVPGDAAAVMDTIRQVNARIARLDDARTIRFLDVSEKFVAPDGEVQAALMPDSIHPGESGYRAWAEAMEATLAQMME